MTICGIRLATDETRIKHRFGKGMEQEGTEKTEVGRKRTQRAQSQAELGTNYLAEAARTECTPYLAKVGGKRQ